MASSSRERLPTGTVTFMFTDIEGSTRLLSTHRERYEDILARHAQLIRAAIEAQAGSEVNTEGDSFFAAFSSAVEAVRAAVDAQRALARHSWPEAGGVRVRMGLHTGEGRLGGDDYIGLDVHRAARIAAAAHGGQVVLSEATHGLVAQALPDGVTARDLGEHRLKDLPAAERIWQLEIEGLPMDFPPLRSLDARPHNLPLSPTPLIGRDEELVRAGELLRARRMLTLSGPGGAGKTRLALALAERLLGDFADGAFVVRLEDARDRPAVASHIAAALGIRERSDRDLEKGVKEYLRERELLLVLDNFEQVLGAAPLVSELLAGARRLRVIVTSRAVLHLSGEQEYAVPPLRLPDPNRLPGLAALSRYEAVALFIERAQAVRPDFEMTDDNARAVAEICARLDGLPLALELAAARIRLLTPQAILDRLQRSLPVLSSGASDLPARQRTLEAAIDWSYQLLREEERRFFERLGVFAGGWTMDAAAAVCDPDGELGLATIDALAELSDKSLIHAISSDAVEDRFEMLQVIRQFAGKKLAGGLDGEIAHRRHALHMLALAEEAEPQLILSDVRRWQRRLRLEEENLRVALRWALKSGEAETGLRMAGALWRFWHYWGQLREGIAWLEALLELPGARPADVARAAALTGLAGLVYWLGDAERADRLYQETLSIHERLGDSARTAETLLASAYTAVGRGDIEAAMRRAQAALERYRELDDRDGMVLVNAWLRTGAYLADAGGSYERAVEAAQEALDVARRLGRAHEEADAVGTLASLHAKAGDFPRALERFRDATRAWHRMGNAGMLPWARMGATLELRLGRPERAVRLAAVAAKAVEELGGMLPEGLIGAGDPLEEVRTFLSEDEYARGVQEGRAMEFDQVAAYLLEEEPERISAC